MILAPQLTPATPSAAFALGKEVSDPVEMYLNDVFTVTVNLAGLPGIAVPLIKHMQYSRCQESSPGGMRIEVGYSPRKSRAT